MTVNLWDVAPLAEEGDPNVEIVHQAVGFALTNWEMLDWRLAEIFSALVGSHFLAAEAAYSQIISIGTRNAMICEAAKRVLYPPTDLNKELSQFLDQVGKLAGRRNDIAHGVAITFVGADQFRSGVFLAPNGSNHRKQTTIPIYQPFPQRPHPFNELAYAYVSGQIVGYGITFWNYMCRACEFQQRVEVEVAKRLARP